MGFGHASAIMANGQATPDQVDAMVEQMTQRAPAAAANYLLPIKSIERAYERAEYQLGLKCSTPLNLWKSGHTLIACRMVGLDFQATKMDDIKALQKEFYQTHQVIPIIWQHEVFDRQIAENHSYPYKHPGWFKQRILDTLVDRSLSSQQRDEALIEAIMFAKNCGYHGFYTLVKLTSEEKADELFAAADQKIAAQQTSKVSDEGTVTEWIFGVPSVKIVHDITDDDLRCILVLRGVAERVRAIHANMAGEQNPEYLVAYEEKLKLANIDLEKLRHQASALFERGVIDNQGNVQLDAEDPFNRAEQKAFLRFALAKGLMRPEQLSIGDENMLRIYPVQKEAQIEGDKTAKVKKTSSPDMWRL